MQSRPFSFTAIAATALLASCGGTSYSYQNVTVTLSPQITTINVGASQVFTTTTSNAPNLPIFFLVPGGVAAAGTLNSAAGQAATTYTAPATPPIYTLAQVAEGAVQGKTGVQAFVSNNPNQLFSDAEADESFYIIAPSITAGISPMSASVPRGTSVSFMGYAVGSTNGAVTFQVGGVPGGSTALGTITAAGLYTAPTAIPITGPAVVITVISTGDPTKTATATVTIT